MTIQAKELDKAVMTSIRKQAEVVLNSEKLSDLRKIGAESKKVVEYEKVLKQCTVERQSYYERFVLREIDRETYLSLKEACTAKIDKLNNQIAVIKQAERDRETSKKIKELAQKIIDESLTSRELVEMLIDKVIVSPGKKIKIRWKVADFADIE
jgi:hypothetical protein